MSRCKQFTGLIHNLPLFIVAKNHYLSVTSLSTRNFVNFIMSKYCLVDVKQQSITIRFVLNFKNG